MIIPDEATPETMPEAMMIKESIASRKFLLSKLKPEVFGDRLQVHTSGRAAAVHIYLPQKAGHSPRDNARVIDGTACELEQLPPTADDDSSD